MSASKAVSTNDFETINIDGDEKHIDELFTPTVTISEDANDDGVITANELNGDVDVIVGLPLGASVGDTIRVSDGTTTNEIVLVELKSVEQNHPIHPKQLRTHLVLMNLQRSFSDAQNVAIPSESIVEP